MGYRLIGVDKMKNLIRLNIRLMLKRKSFVFIMTLMLLLAVGIPIFFLVKYRGEYRYSLPSAETLFLINADSEWWGYISMLIPFMWVMPYGFSYLYEYKAGVSIYLKTRDTIKTYYYSQMFACFLGSAMVFLIPTFLNIILTAGIFEINGNDYVMGYQRYDTNWCNSIMGTNFYKNTLFHGALFKSLYINHPFIFSVLKCVWSSVEMGVFGVFVYSVSLIIKKGSVWLLMFVYVFNQLFRALNNSWLELEFFGIYMNWNISDYLAGGYPGYGLYYPCQILLLIVMIVVSFKIVKKEIQGEQI